MRVFSQSEIANVVAKLGELGNGRVQGDEHGLFFDHREARCIDLEYPPKLEQLPFFARLLAHLGYQATDFTGALLWVTSWGVWNPLDEAVGYRIVEGMNRAAGQPLSFELAPGHSFRADELADAVGMLMQPMVFSWDAFYLPTFSVGCEEFFVYNSHDAFVTVVTRTAEFYDRAFRTLEHFELGPREGSAERKRQFCRT